jgi:chemotaxis receptor (MCP) glutamine deamidase CheD
LYPTLEKTRVLCYDNLMSENYSPEFQESLPVLRVAIGEWKKDKDSILETMGLGTCFGIAIYDPTTKLGFLAHLINPGSADKEELDEMSSELLASTSDPSKVKVWLRGGELLADHKGLEFGMRDREFTEQYMLELGILPENLDIEWLDNFEDAVDIRLNCKSGLCEITVEPWQDSDYSVDFDSF